jgi:hypothetical protein
MVSKNNYGTINLNSTLLIFVIWFNGLVGESETMDLPNGFQLKRGGPFFFPVESLDWFNQFKFNPHF